METQKLDYIRKERRLPLLCTLIGAIMLSINIHVGLNIISVLTTCTFIFGQVCIFDPSFFETSGMHRSHFEGRHLV